MPVGNPGQTCQGKITLVIYGSPKYGLNKDEANLKAVATHHDSRLTPHNLHYLNADELLFEFNNLSIISANAFSVELICKHTLHF